METNLTIGIVTPPEAVSLFENALVEFGELDLKTLVYKQDEEISSIINKYLPYLDVIIFAGPLSYYMNKELIPDHITSLYVESSHSELMKGLLQWEDGAKQKYQRVSLDTFSRTIVREVYKEISQDFDRVYVKEFNPSESAEEIIRFHQTLWTKGQIDRVITCRTSVLRMLTQMGIPCQSVLPTQFNIRESILQAALLGENSKSLESQIAVGIFSIDGGISGSDYEREMLKLDFHRGLVDLSKKIDASIVPVGPLEFLLYTNRGLVEEWIRAPMQMPMLDLLKQSLSVGISVGFGIGRTTRSALSNAKRALERARGAGGDCGYVVKDNGKLVGPLGKGVTIHYFHKTDDPFIQQIASDTNLSVETISKMLKFANSDARFTADDMASVLNMTARNARNVLKKLKELGYVKEMGKEKPYLRGRPRQTFSLNFQFP